MTKLQAAGWCLAFIAGYAVGLELFPQPPPPVAAPRPPFRLDPEIGWTTDMPGCAW